MRICLFVFCSGGRTGADGTAMRPSDILLFSFFHVSTDTLASKDGIQSISLVTRDGSSDSSIVIRMALELELATL